jgi:glycosyltransferase involved in cell wall biosynthesis
LHRIQNIPTYQKLSSGPTYQKLLLVDPFLVLLLRRVLKLMPFDLIHAHHFEGLLVAKLGGIGHRIPVIFDAHTLLESELPHYRLGLPIGLKKRLGAFLDQRLPISADHIISVTDQIKLRMKRYGYQDRKATVVYNGVECDHFNQGSDVCAATGLNTKIVAYAGSMDDFQGIDLLLKAFQKALMQRDDMQLMIITQSSFDKYRSLAQELRIWPHICLVHSNFQDLPSHLVKADIVLNPRIDCDGYPVKLLNYMASGKPIVSFEGSAKNLVHGVNGWIVRDADIQAFADAITMLLEKPLLAKSLGINAKVHSSKMHSWEAIARKLEMVYDSTIKSYRK